MRLRAKRTALSAIGIGAGVLALSSAAFACTNFQSQAVWSGNGTGSSDHTVIGAHGNGMLYCSGFAPTNATKVTNGTGNGQLAVTVSDPTHDSTHCNASGGNKLNAANYNLGTSDTSSTSWPATVDPFPSGTTDACGTHGVGNVKVIPGTLSVDSSGAGSATFTAGNGSNQYWNNNGGGSGEVWTVCVYNNDSPAIGTFIWSV